MRRLYLSHMKPHAVSLRPSAAITQNKELEKASDNEPEIWPQWLVAHLKLKDLKPHDADVPFIMRRLKYNRTYD